MPRRPKTLCRQQGCGALIDVPGYCAKHAVAAQLQDRERRGSAHERGYTSVWAKARAKYLLKHPLCVRCDEDGRVEAATVVDHIKPHRLKPALDSKDEAKIARAKALFWDTGNWAPLCKHHHDVKTATEDGGFGRARKVSFAT